MADIRQQPLPRHFRDTPSEHVAHRSGGRVRYEGSGTSSG